MEKIYAANGRKMKHADTYSWFDGGIYRVGKHWMREDDVPGELQKEGGEKEKHD